MSSTDRVVVEANGLGFRIIQMGGDNGDPEEVVTITISTLTEKVRHVTSRGFGSKRCTYCDGLQASTVDNILFLILPKGEVSRREQIFEARGTPVAHEAGHVLYVTSVVLSNLYALLSHRVSCFASPSFFGCSFLSRPRMVQL